MKKINIKQRSLSWLNMRSTRVGASESWGIIYHYASDSELLAAGIDPEEAKKEIPYITAYGLFRKIKNKQYPSLIDVWDSQFGEAVEAWVKSKYEIAPKSEVYYDSLNICSLDLADAKNGPWVAPVVEIKSRREIAEKIPFKWQLQTSLQCRAKQCDKAIILQIALKGFDEHIRTCAAFAYSKMSKKKFLQYFDNLEKIIFPTEYTKDDRLLSLYDVCLSRFWKDVDNNNAPIPTLSQEPNSSAVNLLLGSFVDSTIYDLTRYVKLKRLEKIIKEELGKEKQKVFEQCLNNKAVIVQSNNLTGKWASNGALLVK